MGRKVNYKIGDMFLYEDELLGVEEECMLVEANPMYLILVTASNIWLKSIKGVNEDKFIPIIDLATL